MAADSPPRKSKLMALLSRDHGALAEQAVQAGDTAKAAHLFAKAGEFFRAGQLYAQLGDEPAAVSAFLTAALGEIPDGYGGSTALQAGELLIAAGHPKAAICLFEMCHAYPQAGETALKLGDPLRAARLFEKGQLWRSAGLYYRKAGRLEHALKAYEKESVRLGRQDAGRNQPHLLKEKRKVDAERMEILQSLGRAAEASRLRVGGGSRLDNARLLESEGRYLEAVQLYLELGESSSALRLIPKIPGLTSPRRADLLRRAGRLEEAVQLLITKKQPAEAAALLEQEESWGEAARLWQQAGEPEKAAQALLRGGRPGEAAQLYTFCGEPEKAAQAWLDSGAAEKAATAWREAGRPRRAAAAYLQAQRPMEAATLLRDSGFVAESLSVLAQVPRSSSDFPGAVLMLVPQLLEQNQADAAQKRLAALPADALAGALEEERLYWQGRVFEAQGVPEKARSFYQQVIDRRPGYRDVAARLTALSAPKPASPLAPTVPEARPPAAVARSPMSGALLAGRFQLLEELGRGGMGRVYRALDRDLGEEVALKTLLRPPDAESNAEDRLLREVQICRKISHPNVVRVYDLGRFDGGLFVTMELLQGQGLDSLVQGKTDLQLGRIRSILVEICSGLHAAHQMGIVHRDLKPSNVLLTADRVKILDFGIARMADLDTTSLTATGAAIGSPRYMSPEQVQGWDVDRRSDLYSLGILAFALLTGREPFLGNTFSAIALQQLNETPPDLRSFRPGLSLDWMGLVGRLLEKEADRRPASAAEVQEALEGLPT